MTTPFKREVDRLMRMNEEAMDGDDIVGHRDGCVWLRKPATETHPASDPTAGSTEGPRGA
jgi:hypothetical protein